jgi:hypothetical protein
MNPNALPFALGAILLGAVSIWFHDFALQWQPVPAGFPMRTQLVRFAFPRAIRFAQDVNR